MSGRWRVDPTEIGKHDHLLIETDEGRRLALNDARRFGSVDLVPTDELQEWPRVPGARAGAARARCAGSSDGASPAARRDQAAAARPGHRRGPGQHLCVRGTVPRGHQSRAARRFDLARSGSKRLVPAIHDVLDEAIAAGGSTLRDFASPDGELGYFSKRFAVYDREGKPCALRRHGEADRPGRPLDLLLPHAASVDLRG